MSAPNTQPRARRRLLSRVGIQSKLLLMILVMSVLAALTAGGIGFQSGRSSLREAVFERLTGIREVQSRTVEGRWEDIRNSVLNTAANDTSLSAMGAFTAGFDRLADATITGAQSKAIDTFYAARFADASDTGGTIDVNALLPTSNAQMYLQAFYTPGIAAPKAGSPANNTGDTTGDVTVADAGDGSSWSAANARYDPYFQRLV